MKHKNKIALPLCLGMAVCIAISACFFAGNANAEAQDFSQAATEPATESTTENTTEPATAMQSADDFEKRTNLIGSAKIDTSKVKKIACVGDSITYGSGVKKTRDTDSYVAQLQLLTGIEALNFGKGGRTLQNEADKPYRNEKEYTQSLSSNADLFIIMLGTNDSKPYNWNKERYKAELKELAVTYRALQNSPQVVLMQPPKSFANTKYSINKDTGSYMKTNIYDQNIRNELYSAVAEVGKELDCPVVDLYSLTEAHSEWFPDGVHPNLEGNNAIAGYIKSEIFDK